MPENKPIERYTEHHFYWMPDTCEMYLAAVCAIQDYFTWVCKRGVDPHVTVYCPNAELDFLIPTITKDSSAVVESVRNMTRLTLEGFDQTVKFDPELAYKLSLKTEKHVTQVFGMMIGSDPFKVLPNIDCITEEFHAECDILVLPFVGSEVVLDFLLNNKPELVVKHASSDLFWQAALRPRLLVGVRSGLTYLAAAAGRAVVEIYPTDCHRNWLSKWGATMYQMIYGNPGEVSPELVYRAVEAMWKKVEQRQRAMV